MMIGGELCQPFRIFHENAAFGLLINCCFKIFNKDGIFINSIEITAPDIIAGVLYDRTRLDIALRIDMVAQPFCSRTEWFTISAPVGVD
jgi:hypothetical protein